MADLTSLPIRQLLTRVHTGQIRIPAFQREFVWDPERISHFVDSIYKGYPYGSLLFWATTETLESDRSIGPYELPMPADKSPITYVLDGQQRVTSLFMTFQTELPRPNEGEWAEIYFDLSAEPSAQQSQFLALVESEVDQSTHFPLRTLFDSAEYRKATDQFRDRPDYLEVLDDLHSRFKEAIVPIQGLETDDRAAVAIVFERINRMGVELSPLELLAAWTWSEDFDLRQKFVGLQEELELFSFGDAVTGGDLVLRCCSAILKADPSIEALMKLDGEVIRQSFDRVENGIKGAVDFLSQQLDIDTVKTLPYPLMLVPLSVYFSTPGNEMRQTPAAQIEVLKQWFWRACFAERYSGQTLRAARADILDMQALRDGREHQLAKFSVSISHDFFLNSAFRMNSARTATFVNLLASRGPRTFLSGNSVNLRSVLQAYNKSEFHHIFPKAYLEELKVEPAAINSLANFCFLSRVDNNKIRRKAPSEYRKMMPLKPELDAAILTSALVEPGDFDTDFETFRNARARRLAVYARRLAGLSEPEAE